MLSQGNDFDELDSETYPYDEVAHFGVAPCFIIGMDGVMSQKSTYNVIKASVKLEISRIIFTNSKTTYDVYFLTC